MAFPTPPVVTQDLMIPEDGIENFSSKKSSGNQFELLNISVLSLSSFDILLELLRIDEVEVQLLCACLHLSQTLDVTLSYQPIPHCDPTSLPTALRGLIPAPCHISSFFGDCFSCSMGSISVCSLYSSQLRSCSSTLCITSTDITMVHDFAFVAGSCSVRRFYSSVSASSRVFFINLKC